MPKRTCEIWASKKGRDLVEKHTSTLRILPSNVSFDEALELAEAIIDAIKDEPCPARQIDNNTTDHADQSAILHGGN